MDIDIETVEPQSIVGVRTQTSMATIGDDIGRLAGQVMGVAAPFCSGTLMAIYHTWDEDGGEFEIAVPVRETPPELGPLQASELPGGRAVVGWYVGPYENLKSGWEGVKAWMEENGHEGTAPPWEEYVSDPSVTPPEQLRTKIVWPIG